MGLSHEKYPGTGIGLAIVRKIIERHHGQITAMGELNQGATFILTLPVTQKQFKEVENVDKKLAEQQTTLEKKT